MRSASKLLLILFLSVLCLSTPAIEKETPPAEQVSQLSAKERCIKIASKITLNYLYLWSSIFAHEMGHKIALKAFLDTSSTIEMSINPIKFFFSYGGITIPDRPVSTKGWRYAAYCAAGPIVGALYCYALLKLSNFMPQSPWLDPIKESIEKETLTNAVTNLCNLVPFVLPNFHAQPWEPQSLPSDGYQIWNALT